jgi:hypothetical protein
VDGIRKREPCVESRGVLATGSRRRLRRIRKEVLETMTAATFDVVDNKVIDLKSK